MEHVHEYNEAVTKLRLLLDSNDFPASDITRSPTSYPVKQPKDQKRWSSHEDLLNHSNHTKGELRTLVSHQEDYIGQLEEELSFCRNQLNETISKVRQATVHQEKETQEVIHKLRSENDSLKKQLDAKHENLKRDNVWLVSALQSLKDESMELQRRETEAVEQVRQSIHMAEQISLEKTQLELELNQVKQQLDRQQERVKAIIEEQLDKVEEVRLKTEQRCREEYAAVRDQADQHAGQLAQLTADLEHCQRKETELKRQMRDQKALSDRVQDDYETRIGHLHLEVVNLRSTKQQLDHELSCLRVDYEHSKSDLDSFSARHRNEVECIKSRLQRTEQLLEESRTETLNLTDNKSQLERELNLFKLSLNKSAAGGEESADNPATVSQLRVIVHKQKHIIDGLRTQCTDLATKLESVSTSYSDQVSRLSHQLGESMSQIQVLDGQSRQYGQMYEQCCRKIQDLEREKVQMAEEIEDLIRGKTSMQMPKRYTSSTPRMSRQHHQQYQKEAIVIEQDGQISSPLSATAHAKNRN